MRFDLNAKTHDDALCYIKRRALQLAHTGAELLSVKKINEGLWAKFMYNGEYYYSLYVLEQYRGNNMYLKLYRDKCDIIGYTIKIFTSTNCQLVKYLDYKKIPHIVIDGLTQTPEYKLIERLYGSDKAKRSGVYFMNHIDEGLYILYKLNARTKAKLGYILHPIFQSDTDIVNNITLNNINELDVKAVILAVEYRNIANSYLSTRKINSLDEIKLSPLGSVDKMLIADKIQNRKDFELYHINTHPRSIELDWYFKAWLKKLNITEEEYQQYKDELIKISAYKHVLIF